MAAVPTPGPLPANCAPGRSPPCAARRPRVPAGWASSEEDAPGIVCPPTGPRPSRPTGAAKVHRHQHLHQAVRIWSLDQSGTRDGALSPSVSSPAAQRAHGPFPLMSEDQFLWLELKCQRHLARSERRTSSAELSAREGLCPRATHQSVFLHSTPNRGFLVAMNWHR